MNSFALDRVAPGGRAIRLGEGPSLSVVVASFRERPLVDACLASLLPQCRALGAETIVARACSDPVEIAEMEAAYPSVRFVRAPADATIPQLRAAGMAAAGGDIVALTEDHCVVAPDWVPQLLRAHAGDADIVGGSMDNAQRRRAVDWAAYFAEYGFFAERAEQPGQRPMLTGANVAYSRRVVDDVVAWAREGEWENVAHDRLWARGSTLQFLRTAAVYQNRSHRFLDFCRDRFVHGLDYARRRLVGEGGLRRWLYLPGTAVLPLLLTMRVGRAIGSDQRGPFLRALPLTFAFLAAWSAGEAVGYWLGASGPRTGDG